MHCAHRCHVVKSSCALIIYGVTRISQICSQSQTPVAEFRNWIEREKSIRISIFKSQEDCPMVSIHDQLRKEDGRIHYWQALCLDAQLPNLHRSCSVLPASLQPLLRGSEMYPIGKLRVDTVCGTSVVHPTLKRRHMSIPESSVSLNKFIEVSIWTEFHVYAMLFVFVVSSVIDKTDDPWTASLFHSSHNLYLFWHHISRFVLIVLDLFDHHLLRTRISTVTRQLRIKDLRLSSLHRRRTSPKGQ